MSPYYTSSGSHTPQDGAVLIFTVGVFSVGLMSYLYLRSLNVMSEMKRDIQVLTDSLHEVHENTNNMFLRVEDLEERDEKGSQGSLNDIEEGRHQAWVGRYEDVESSSKIDIRIIREKYGTFASNKDWLSWSGESNASTIVRDYYLDSFDSDYDWSISDTTGVLKETLVNGWNSVIHVRIEIQSSKKDITREALTQVFQRCKKTSLYTWTPELVDKEFKSLE